MNGDTALNLNNFFSQIKYVTPKIFHQNKEVK